MKKNLLLLSIGLSLATISCKKVENFLDKPPGVDVNEDLIFSAQVQTEKYVADMYQLGMPNPFPIRAADAGFGGGLPSSNGGMGGTFNTALIGITDEGEPSESFSAVQDWNTAGVTPSNIVSREDLRYFVRWQAIRAANIILERINQVPDADQSYKDMVTGEALFIRAISNFEMLKRYGGFPIVNKRVVTIEESKIPRSTFEECVNTIVKDCNDAVAKLPANQPSNFIGRAHKGAALALKARTLLYAASPLFNAAAPPVSFGSATDDKLIVYGNYDLNRWKLAADAEKAVLDWAAGAGYALLDVPANRIPVITPGGIVSGNYRNASLVNDNPEIILASKVYIARGIGQFPWQYFIPNKTYVANSQGDWTAPTITFNFVRKYEKRDGTPQIWNYSGGNDLLAKYNELDPRFAQTVVYVGARLHANATRVPIWDGGALPKALSNSGNCKGGHWLLKFIPDAIPSGAGFIPNCPVFRMNEVLLSYAEALNEFSGPSTEAFDAVNKVRARSGMPALPATLNQDQFRQRLRNERDIELAFEDYRFMDIRRWKIAEQDGVMQGNFWGLKIQTLNNTAPFPTAFSYLPFVFEPRTWYPKEYFFPYDLTEVLKGNLKQNPGW